MLLIIDNFDSFTYNLVHYFEALGEKVTVINRDAISIEKISTLNPSHLVLSPGPGSPADAAIIKEIIYKFKDRLPILGVCLGHQCIVESFGGTVTRCSQIMHGKISNIYHNNQDIFTGCTNPFKATRYHSLAATVIPESLTITAWTTTPDTCEKIIMGIKHNKLPIFGVQFHPESILSEHGHLILKNFLEIG